MTSAADIAGNTRTPFIVIGGPTGSGKSGLASALAGEFGGVVVNADSAQVYRELRILTARPTREDEEQVPHRLYGILPAAERCSVGRWLSLATAEIETARSARRLPIVVGGTGLYLRSLKEGLVRLPEIPAPLRGEAEALHARLGGAEFRLLLAQRDPESAARLPAADRQRLIRAWEVVEHTGRALPDWQRLQERTAAPLADSVQILLLPPRERLYPALDDRFDRMIDGGALGEVERLLALGLDPALPAMKALGVRELARHLRGECTLPEAVAAARGSTRRYAKRQYTWFRHQVQPDLTTSAQFSESCYQEILSFIRRELLTRRT